MKTSTLILILLTSIVIFAFLIKQRTKEDPQKKVQLKPIITHEVDKKVVTVMDHTIEKLKQLLEAYQDSQSSQQLETWLSELIELKQQYTRVSPALAALGPIGTTSIVLKEEKIEKHLEKLLQKIDTFLGIE